MFKIDLLKGQGIPIKSRPLGIAIAAVTLAVPIIVAIVMFSFYLNNKIIVSVKKQEINRCQAEIDKLSDAVELQKSFEKEKIIYSQCLKEVKSSLGRYTQWSPVLVTLLENMPNTVKLTGLDVKEHYVRKRVPKIESILCLLRLNHL